MKRARRTSEEQMVMAQPPTSARAYGYDSINARKRKRSFGDGSVGSKRPPPPRICLRRPMRRPRTVSLPARRKRAMETDDRSNERSDAAVGTTSGRWARVAGSSRPGSPRSRNKQTNHLARTRAPALIRSLCNVCVSVSSSSARATSRAFYHIARASAGDEISPGRASARARRRRIGGTAVRFRNVPSPTYRHIIPCCLAICLSISTCCL
jgi:hypothetical protein